MAIGERIHFFRNKRNMTLRFLGQSVGFPEKSADVRLAQYENGSRAPKADLTEKFAEVLDVSPKALVVPDIDSYDGLMHTLFTLEDNYGLHIDEIDGEVCLRLNKNHKEYAHMIQMLTSWNEEYQKKQLSDIDTETYDDWRYHYPERDTTQRRARIPSILDAIDPNDLK